MCLGIPGKILTIEPNPLGMTMGRVSFGGVTKDVCLAYVPDAKLNDFVVVHVGFALSIIDEQQAGTIYDYLKLNQHLTDLEVNEAAAPPLKATTG